MGNYVAPHHYPIAHVSVSAEIVRPFVLIPTGLGEVSRGPTGPGEVSRGPTCTVGPHSREEVLDVVPGIGPSRGEYDGLDVV